MKKNGQYVGVDEKYIPEEEKYVDNSANSEIKEFVNDGIKSAKDYVSDKDNQEKIKNTGRKGLKILKGVGIGYLVFIGFIILIFIVIFIFAITNILKVNSRSDEVYDKATNIIDNVIDNVDNNDSSYSSYDISSFNNDLEMYKGTTLGSRISQLLDNVLLKSIKIVVIQ